MIKEITLKDSITEIDTWAYHINSMEIHQIEKIEGNVITLKGNYSPKIQLVFENGKLRDRYSNGKGNVTYHITNVFHYAFIEQQKMNSWFKNHKFTEEDIQKIYTLLS